MKDTINDAKQNINFENNAKKNENISETKEKNILAKSQVKLN